jgi:hypothetical protein
VKKEVGMTYDSISLSNIFLASIALVNLVILAILYRFSRKMKL